MAETALRLGAVRAVPAQTFTMGSDDHYPEEAPARRVTVAGFAIEAEPVTNRRFAEFVRETGYRTVAERPLDPAQFPGLPPDRLRPGSMVFHRTGGPVDLRHLEQWWDWVPGAFWRRPFGPGSTVRRLGEHPVVHVAREDALAYAAWAGRGLPTEAEWEAAARGGLEGAVFTWGDAPEPADRPSANYWHGGFPYRPDPGYGGTTPVGAFPRNGYGLADMAGNVWEWTADAYDSAAAERSCCGAPPDPAPPDPAAPDPATQAIPRGVVKGGSFLCADSYCRRYRPAARRPQPIDTGMSHIGFRCVRRPS